jgi:Bacterial Ig domain
MRRFAIAVVVLLAFTAEAAPQGASRRRSVRHPGAGPAPLAVADSYSTNQGATLTIAAPGVLANDTLHGGGLRSFGPLTGVEQTTLGAAFATAAGGSLALAGDGALTYTPAAGFSGSDTFRYVIGNGGGSASALVTIEVSAVQISANIDSYTTAPETSLFVPAPGVLTNDTLGGATIASFGPGDGTEQTSLNGTAPTAAGGVVALTADGSFSYDTPPQMDDGYGNFFPFQGLDHFVYILRNGSGLSAATVHLTVQNPPGNEDFTVTSPGHFYAISGLSGENPVLELKRGRTYTFRISASPVHPFAILDAPPGSVTNNNITDGLLTFTVPATAQNYRYRCTTHLFGNTIVTVP